MTDQFIQENLNILAALRRLQTNADETIRQVASEAIAERYQRSFVNRLANQGYRRQLSVQWDAVEAIAAQIEHDAKAVQEDNPCAE